MQKEESLEMQPLVSVVIPVYNDGVYLAESLNSALSQTYANLEVIIVNDGSTDSFTLSVLENIKFPNVRVIHKENGHLSSARNAGIANANGEYILTLDADDRFDKRFVQLALPCMKEDNVGVVTCFVKSFGDKSYKWKPRGGGVNSFILRNECCGNSLFRKSIWKQVGGYDENMKLGYEDWEFWIRVTKTGWNVKVIDQYLFNYRISSKTMMLSSSEPNRKEIVKYIAKKHGELYTDYFIDSISKWTLVDKRKVPRWYDILDLLRRKFQLPYRKQK